jgi:GalNAc-alpha-(1->4)-GalNAc-alpha-(1->3)-diNAcBac-PP-undecaprenol alpha-1,4-N-acetyl-D-galactosaminyltransferase
VRILLAIPSLRCGGSERVMSTLAGHWATTGHDVSLATFAPPEQDFFALDARIRRFVIGETGPAGPAWLRSNHGRVQGLRRAIRETRPQVVVSFLYTMNLVCILAARGLAPVIVSERTDPRYRPVEAWQAVLRRLLYPRAGALVVQTEEVLDGWALRAVGRSRAYAIPNPVVARTPGVWPDGTPPAGRLIASAGRLEGGKGFDVLVDAFARLAADHREWLLVIIGDGDQRAALTAQASGYGLAGRVLFPGTLDSAALFARADIFATASRVEGFPNALLEAMAAGLPVVATDCHSGPREIVREGLDGYLVSVDDVAQFTSALRRLMDDEELRRRCGQTASEVLDRFAIDRVAGEWEMVFREVRGEP